MVREAEVEGHEVGIYDEEIGEVFLDGAYDFVVVCFGEAFQRGLFYYVAEVCTCQQSLVALRSSKRVQMLYSPYLGSRSSSIRLCIDSGDGRTKHRQRRWRIFSRFGLSIRLPTC